MGIPLIWSIGVAISIVRAGARNPTAHADVAIVLGAAVWDAEPSPVFAARIDHAIWLLEKRQVKQLIFTGGKARGDTLSEAAAAQNYALSKGVPQEAIYLEGSSTSTYENLANSKHLMQDLGARTVVIVSDPYHLLRVRLWADRIGMTYVLSPTPTPRYQSFSAKSGQLSRETYYTTRLLLTGR